MKTPLSRKIFGLAALFVLAACLTPGGLAIAAEVIAAPTPSTAIDLAPLVQPIIVTLGTIVSAAGAALIRYLLARVGLERQTALQQTAEGILQNAVRYGMEAAQAKVQGGALTVDVRSQVIAQAASYAIQHGPDVLARLGVSRDQLEAKLLARLNGILVDNGTSTVLPVPAK